MNINTDFRLPQDSYFPEKPKKDLIVLHHTVGGSARSTFDYWRTDSEPIATAYIVERDGTIYEVFPPECWAYHLGLKIAPKGVVDKRSIGIEIASEGPLLARDGRFYSFGRMSEQTLFNGAVYTVTEELTPGVSDPRPSASVGEHEASAGSREQSARVQPLAAEPWNNVFRGYRYFAAYTPQAVASVCELVDSLLTRFNIPRQTPAAHTAFDLNGLRNYRGVLTHCQLRADKSDCHPGFDWPKLITDCGLQITAQLDINAMAAEDTSSEFMAAM